MNFFNLQYELILKQCVAVHRRTDIHTTGGFYGGHNYFRNPTHKPSVQSANETRSGSQAQRPPNTPLHSSKLRIPSPLLHPPRRRREQHPQTPRSRKRVAFEPDLRVHRTRHGASGPFLAAPSAFQHPQEEIQARIFSQVRNHLPSFRQLHESVERPRHRPALHIDRSVQDDARNAVPSLARQAHPSNHRPFPSQPAVHDQPKRRRFDTPVQCEPAEVLAVHRRNSRRPELHRAGDHRQFRLPRGGDLHRWARRPRGLGSGVADVGPQGRVRDGGADRELVDGEESL